MNVTPSRIALVTGASSGIGKATAEHLATTGMTVFAGVRRFSSEASAAREILLDVTSPDSLSGAVREIDTLTAGAGLDVLVNNAGIGAMAPVEFTSPECLRQVFEVDVFGLVAVTQAFLPQLRKNRGVIVNIGSIGGMITLPFGAALCAAKHAVEALSDAFRMEWRDDGIRVALLQPASINSGAAEKLVAEIEETIARLPPEGRERYGVLLRKFSAKVLKEETAGSPPGVVARAVRDLIENPHPPARTVVGRHAHLLRFLARNIPDAWREKVLRKMFLE